MKNQNGFATLEIILVTAIISLLAFVGVPKLAKIFDVVMLDYEVKRFCSELEFARSASRTASYGTGIFQYTIKDDLGKNVDVQIYYEKNSYRVMQDVENLREPYKLGGGINLVGKSNSPEKILFSKNYTYSSGSGTVYFSSRLGNSAEVRFDSVGRWRGYRDVK